MSQNHIAHSLKKYLLSVGVSTIALMIFATPATQAQNVASLNPTSGWNLKSDTDANNGYCALSRSFDDNVVLTLGRNAAEEYSLAIDFQKAKLDTDKAYPITLQPGPGQIRAYEMMPTSPRAVVVRLGYDDSFFKALETSKLLKAEINKVKYNFQINDMSKGQTQLNNCLAKIKGDAPVKVANNFKAEKIDEAEKIKSVAKSEPSPTVAVKKEPPKPIEIKKAKVVPKVDTPLVDVPKQPEKLAAVEVKAKEPKAPKEITIERVGQKEIAASKVVAVAPKAVEAPKAEAKKIEIKKAEPKKIESNKVDSDKVEVNVAQKSIPAPVAIPKATIAAAAPVVVTPTLQRPTEMGRSERTVSRVSSSNGRASNVAPPSSLALQAPNPSKGMPAVKAPIVKAEKVEPKKVQKPVEVKVASKNDYKAPITPDMMEAPKPFSSSASAKVEKKNVVNDIKPDVSNAEIMRLEKEEARKIEAQKQKAAQEAQEINKKQKDLAKAVKEQEDKLASLDKADTKNDVEIRNIREEIAILRIENKKLYQEAEKARGQLDSVAVESGNQALKRIREYERKLEAAKADNLALSREMENMQLLQEQGRLKPVNGNASLTQSTIRFNEAEREINRLGLLLEQQRSAHLREKKELEGMLFDPAVTSEQQRQRLAELESKLKNSEAQYARAQEELSKRAAVVPKEIIKPDPKTEAEKQRLATEKAKLEQQLQLAQRQLEQSQKALQEKPKEVIKVDPKIEMEKKRLAAEKLKLEQELQAAQSQLKQTQVALKEKQNQKPLVTAPDPLVQRNNIQIQQLNKKLSIQNQQLEAYQRTIELEKREQQALKQQAADAAQKAQQAALKAEQAEQMAIQTQREAELKSQKEALARQRQEIEQQRQANAKLEAQTRALAAQQAKQQRMASVASNVAAPLVASPAPVASYSSAKIQGLLRQSGLSTNNGVQRVSSSEYRWNIGAVQGVAKVANKSQTPNMTSFIQGYIANAKQSCKGDFASLPSQTGQPNNFEIACIGGLKSMSSSVLFTERDGHYIAIGHETSPDDMDLAMDARDRVAESL